MKVNEFIKDITIHIQDLDTGKTKQVRIGNNVELLRYISNLPDKFSENEAREIYDNIKENLNKRGSKGYGVSFTNEEFNAIKERVKKGNIQEHFKECFKNFKSISLNSFKKFDGKITDPKESIITIYLKGELREKIEKESESIGTTPNKLIRFLYFKWLSKLKPENND